MRTWNEAADNATIEKTVRALNENGFEAIAVERGEDARRAVLDRIPRGAEVFTYTSVSLDSIGVSEALNKGGGFVSLRDKVNALDASTHKREQKYMGTAPDFAVGSVHAVSESGTLIVASMTGSQIPAYAYGAGRVIWVVGAQKIVRTIDDGFRRINEHIVPLESERARKAYGLPAGFTSFPARILLFNRENQPGRSTVIIVREPLGF